MKSHLYSLLHIYVVKDNQECLFLFYLCFYFYEFLFIFMFLGPLLQQMDFYLFYFFRATLQHMDSQARG